MQHTTLSAKVSALCGVDERTVERWIEEERFSGAFREHAAGRDHRRVPRAHVEQFIVDRDRPSDATALVVVFSPVQGNCQAAAAEMQAQIHAVGLDTLHTDNQARWHPLHQ